MPTESDREYDPGLDQWIAPTYHRDGSVTWGQSKSVTARKWNQVQNRCDNILALGGTLNKDFSGQGEGHYSEDAWKAMTPRERRAILEHEPKAVKYKAVINALENGMTVDQLIALLDQSIKSYYRVINELDWTQGQELWNNRDPNMPAELYYYHMGNARTWS